LLDRARNFGQAVVDHVRLGLPMVDQQEKARRLSICQECDHYFDNTCRRCGCRLDIKAGWAEQSCPEGKWGMFG
jgi:hypothetical protein